MRVPEPASGEIEIRGTRWLWYTMGHYRGGAGDGGSSVRWWVTFHDPDDPARRHTRPLSEDAARDPGDRTLRSVFAEGAGGRPPWNPRKTGLDAPPRRRRTRRRTAD